MRWLFVSLVGLNIAYFSWQYYEVAPQKKAVLLGSVHQGTLVTDNRCVYLGKFTSSAAQNLSQRLASLDIAHQIVQEKQSVTAGYMVYVMPYVNKERALSALRELKLHNIEGHLIGEGDLKNGLSLGLHSSLGESEQVVSAVERLGIKGSVREITEAQVQYWLKIDKRSERLVDENLIFRLNRDFSQLIQQLKSC